MNKKSLTDEEKVKLRIGRLKRKILRKKREFPFKHIYRPYEKQGIFHRFDKKIGVFRGGNGTGKTQAGCEEVCMMGFGWNPYRQIERKKHRLIWVAGDTLTTVEEIILPKMKELLPPETMGRWKYTARPAGMIRPTMYIYNKKGEEICKILLKSYEQGRKAFQGGEPDLIVLDEEPPQDIWTEILARTRSGGIIRITATPFGYGLIHDLIENPSDEFQDVQAHIRDNIYLDEKEIEFLVEQFGEEINRIDGSIYIPEGKIYTTFWDDLLIDEFDKEKYTKGDKDAHAWQFVVCVDTGGTDEFCALFAFYNSVTDKLYIVDEYYRGGADIDMHSASIKAIISLYEPPHVVKFDNNNKVANQMMRKNGLKGGDIIKGPGTVEAGILLARGKINAQKIKIVKGKCPHLRAEYKKYRYNKNGNGQPAANQKDHAVTAMRYMAQSIRPHKPKKSKHLKARHKRGGMNYVLGRTGYGKVKKKRW